MVGTLEKIKNVNSIKEALLLVNEKVATKLDNGYTFICNNMEDEKEIILLKNKAYINKISISLVGLDCSIKYFQNLIEKNLKGSFNLLTLNN